ncbi:uncharacterized protein DUF3135 [Nitrosomonas sp. Nm84]|uniref:DUF3135 domain-containing protein n=1 Tax=Nitrosomonas sp. Nm84 TaxID=200124 RepID=UPI000D751535|nr:DUF3135 domain-containing protein [Nitrosomonas sp. Nm84]PXW88923.1 uncharacterized protein DUF3135 [Nitrosomonas sp. Nm84]
MDKESNISDFDFDVWSQMAQQDPEKFEAMRQQLINDLIAQAPLHLKQRMTGLQWQVDQVRKQASNPMAACLQISQRMWDNVVGEKGLLNALQEPQEILNAIKNEPTGKILSFDRYKPGK